MRTLFFKVLIYNDSLEALLSGNVNMGKDPIGKPMPPSILNETEIEISQQRKEHDGKFVRFY